MEITQEFFNLQIDLEQFGAALCLFQEHFLDLRLPSRGLRRKSPAGWDKMFRRFSVFLFLGGLYGEDFVASKRMGSGARQLCFQSQYMWQEIRNRLDFCP